MVWQSFICHRTGLTLRGLTQEVMSQLVPGGVITSVKPGEFAVATDYDDARRRHRRHHCFGVVGRWRMTRTVGVIAVVAVVVVVVVVVGGIHALVVGGVLFVEEGC